MSFTKEELKNTTFTYRDLPKFDIKTVQNDNTVIFYGQTRSGKTQGALSLYRRLIGVKGSIADNDHVVIYTTQINQKVMRAGFNTDKVFLEQDLTPEHVKQHRKPRTLFVFDDVVGDDFKKADELKKIFCTGRHDCISVIICVQYYSLLHPVWRENASFSFMTRCDSDVSYKQFIKDNLSYAPVSLTPEQQALRAKNKFGFWERMLSDPHRIKGFHTLVKVKNTGLDSVFIYKAPILPPNKDYVIKSYYPPSKKALVETFPQIAGYIRYPLKKIRLRRVNNSVYIMNVTFELTKEERIDRAIQELEG